MGGTVDFVLEQSGLFRRRHSIYGHRFPTPTVWLLGPAVLRLQWIVAKLSAPCGHRDLCTWPLFDVFGMAIRPGEARRPPSYGYICRPSLMREWNSQQGARSGGRV